MATSEAPKDPRDPVRLDAASVKVLAHPLRSRLLGALRRSGPATATDLAAALSTNTGATSYHLRKLESVGLVTDTGEGAGKARLWAASADYTQWAPSDFEGDEDAETALNWLTRDYLTLMNDRYTRWLDVEGTWPSAWRDQLGMNDDVALLTAEQLEAFNSELEEMVTRYRRVGQGNPSAKRIAIYSITYPIDLDRPPVDKEGTR